MGTTTAPRTSSSAKSSLHSTLFQSVVLHFSCAAPPAEKTSPIPVSSNKARTTTPMISVSLENLEGAACLSLTSF